MLDRYTPFTHNILIEVDLQHDFIDGSLAVPGAIEVIDPLNQVARSVRQSAGNVLLTRDWHPSKTPHFSIWPSHCVQFTHGADLHPSIDLQESDFIFSKGEGKTDGYSGMEAVDDEGSNIESIIDASESHRIHVFIGGLATDYCVKATALDLSQKYHDKRNISMYLLTNAIRAVNIEKADEITALRTIEDAGVIALSTAQAIELMSKGMDHGDK